MRTDREPKVSVILPTYNRAGTLARAIRSVLNQSFQDFELIVVDDASSDHTAAVVNEFEDQRLIYHRQSCNGGVAKARNAGIALAKGEWLAFQDSDDEWLLGKLEAQLEAVRKGRGYDMAIGPYFSFDKSEISVVWPRSTLSRQSPFPDILDGWPIITPTWLVRRTCLLEASSFDESYPCFEDWDLILRLAHKLRITAVSQPILIKHGSPDSVCSDRTVLCGSLQRLMASHEVWWSDYPHRLARRYAHIGLMLHRMGQRKASAEFFGRAARLTPLSMPLLALRLAGALGRKAVSGVLRVWPDYASSTPGTDCMITTSRD